jgi:alkylhydroperoxidase family enzyme
MTQKEKSAVFRGTPTARLAAVAPPYSPELEETLNRMTPPGHDPLLLFGAIAHNPAFLDAFRHFGTFLLNHGSVPATEREIVIHRTTARCAADYEWAVHAYFYGARVGLSSEKMQATLDPDAARSSRLDERERLLIRLVDELCETKHVSPELWSQLSAGWTSAELVELVGLVGQYHLVSFLVNALEVPHEEYAKTLAPSGSPAL